MLSKHTENVVVSGEEPVDLRELITLPEDNGNDNNGGDGDNDDGGEDDDNDDEEECPEDDSTCGSASLHVAFIVVLVLASFTLLF